MQNVPMKPPLSVRVCDCACLLYAVWTISCNLVVACHGSLYVLVAVATPVLMATLFVLIRWSRRRLVTEQLPDVPEMGWLQIPGGTGIRLSILSGMALLAIAGLCATRGQHWWWWPLLGWSVWAALLAPAARLPKSAGGNSSPGQERLVWAVAFLAALFPLVAGYGANIDDGYYVNLSVHVADEPHLPLLQSDTLHGLGLPVLLNVTRATSYEVLLGLFSWLTGIRAITVTHLLFPPLAGALVALGHARLLRVLTPRHYGWATAAAVLCMLLICYPSRWLGTFTFPSLHMGKSVLFAAVVPTIVAYALEFSRRPSPLHWTLLAAAQIMGMGLSSTGLWLGPLVALLSLLSGLSMSGRGLRVIGLGVLSCGYVLGVALACKLSMSGDNPVTSWGQRSDLLTFSVGQVFPTQPLLVLGLATLFLAPWSADTWQARRVATVFPLVLLVTFLNPCLCNWLAAHVTAPITHWRSFWCLPFFAILGMIAIWPFRLAYLQGRTALQLGLAAATVLGTVLASHPLWDKIAVAPLALKVAPEYEVAAAVNAAAGQGATVLVPAPVAAWITAQHRHAFPLVARPGFLNQVAWAIGRAEQQRRLELFRYISGERRLPTSADRLRQSVVQDRLAAVCFPRDIAWSGEIRTILAETGMVLRSKVQGFEIWDSEIVLQTM